MAGEPQVDERMEKGIGCRERRAGVCGWAVHGQVRWWEGNFRCYEGLEIMVEGDGIGVVGGSVADVDPGNPCGAVHIQKECGIKPMGEFSGAVWVLGYLLVEPWC